MAVHLSLANLAFCLSLLICLSLDAEGKVSTKEGKVSTFATIFWKTSVEKLDVTVSFDWSRSSATDSITVLA